MDKEDKKTDRVPVTKKTRLRLKKYYVMEELNNYDEGVNDLLDKTEEK